MTVRSDIQESVGGLQTCAGQKAGIEAAIHAMREIYERDECEAMILVDATNAFNSLNRATALRNVKIICPEIAQYLQNSYQTPSRLYISGSNGEFIQSAEGTTQGDNCAMAFYAVSTVPIIDELQSSAHFEQQSDKPHQAWFADDSSAAGTLTGIHRWWARLAEIGPRYGYFPNPAKCVLIVKDEVMKQRAENMFASTGMIITTEGQRHLGAVIGSPQYKHDYVEVKVREWTQDVQKLAKFAESEPQCAYAVYINCIPHR